MKISRLLNKKNYLFFLIFIFFSTSSANEPVDIWNIDKSKIETTQEENVGSEISNEIPEETISVYDLNNQSNDNNKKLVLQETNIENKISLYGLYDPDQNNLSMEMWKESEGEEIKKIFDPEIPVDIYELGLIYDVFVNEDNEVKILMTLTTPNCPVAETLPQEVEEKIKSIDEVKTAEVEITFDPPWTKDLMSEEAKLELGFL